MKRGKTEEEGIIGRRIIIMGIERSIERGIAMIVIGNFVWIIICRFVRGRGWRMWLRLVFVSGICMLGLWIGEREMGRVWANVWVCYRA